MGIVPGVVVDQHGAISHRTHLVTIIPPIQPSHTYDDVTDNDRKRKTTQVEG